MIDVKTGILRKGGHYLCWAVMEYVFSIPKQVTEMVDFKENNMV